MIHATTLVMFVSQDLLISGRWGFGVLWDFAIVRWAWES